MSAATEAEVQRAKKEAEEESESFDFYRGVDHFDNRVKGHIAEIVISRITGWERVLPAKWRTPDLRSPYGMVEVKARTLYYSEPIEVTSTPDLCVLTHYYIDGGMPHICWVNHYLARDLEPVGWKIVISRGRWAERTRKHTPISPSLFTDLPLQR